MERLTENLKVSRLGCSSAELMAMKMVLMMESDWVELTEIYSDKLKESEMERNLVCLSAESREMQMEKSLDRSSAV